MQFHIRDIKNGEEINMTYSSYNRYPPKIIMNESFDTIGYIWFKIIDKIMYIDMIEMIHKEQGYGTLFIRYLFNSYNIDTIRGITLRDGIGRSYYFWMSLGAKFNYNDITSNILDPGRESIEFDLHRPINS